jgi:hypothetical protein
MMVRSSTSFGRRVGGMLVYAALLPMLASCASAPPPAGPGQLLVERGFLSPHRFTYAGSEPRRVFGWITYKQEFLQVLDSQPAARERAERAVPLHYAATAVGVVGIAVGVSQVVSAAANASEAQSISAHNDAATASLRGVGIILGGTLASTLISTAARRDTYAAIEIFNASLGGAGEAGLSKEGRSLLVTTILRPRVEVDPHTLGVSLVWTLRTPTRW